MNMHDIIMNKYGDSPFRVQMQRTQDDVLGAEGLRTVAEKKIENRLHSFAFIAFWLSDVPIYVFREIAKFSAKL